MQSPHLETLARKLKALAEPNRLEIIELLKKGVQCNCELGGKLNQAPNLISHHLKVLTRAGLVNAERDPQDSRWIYYSLNIAAFEQFSTEIAVLLDTADIQPRDPCCGPSRRTLEKSTYSCCS
jgi:ArsR family transcriptional regulator